jgi:Rad3-related DNA helicase
MQIRKAERKLAKIRLALQGPAGSGKTYSAILLASGLIGGLSKVCIIDTENQSADLYAHLGDYLVLPLPKPHTPERYIEAIELAEKEGMQCIIIDSISHC